MQLPWGRSDEVAVEVHLHVQDTNNRDRCVAYIINDPVLARFDRPQIYAATTVGTTQKGIVKQRCRLTFECFEIADSLINSPAVFGEEPNRLKVGGSRRKER